MFELLQVTAQYSNAVLVAIMPQISDFAKKLDLPVAQPVTVAQVREFRCFPFKGDLGGLVIFTNEMRVWYHNGYVNGFRTPRSYYNLQAARDIPRFYGPTKLTKDEALQLARKSVRSLGYSLRETFTDQEPEIEMPPQIGTNVVPHYQFRWKDPVFGRTAVRIEVDAGRKMIQEMRLLSLYFQRSPPRIAIEPVMLNPRSPVSASGSNEFLSAILPKISDYVKKLGLPVKFPVTQRQVERVVFVDFDSDVRIKLTTGHWFTAQHRVITEFSAPETVFGRQPPTVDSALQPLSEYLGRWQVNEKDAIALVREAIRKLGYTPEEFAAEREPNVTKPSQIGKYVVPRYSFRWLTNDSRTGGTIALARAEVDANKRRLTWLQLVGAPVSGQLQNPQPALKSSSNTPVSRMEMLHVLLGTNELRDFPEDDLPASRTDIIPNQPMLRKPMNPYE